MMKGGPRLIDAQPTRSGASAERQVLTQEPFDNLSIKIRYCQALDLQPIAEVGKATQILTDGAAGIPPGLQRLDVWSDQVLQRAAGQPITADDACQECFAGHCGLRG